LRARPRAKGAATHDAALSRQEEQDPGGNTLTALPFLALAEEDLLTQLGHVPSQLDRGRLASTGEGLDGGVLDALEPLRSIAGDAGLFEQLDQLSLLPDLNRPRHGCVHDGDQLGGNNEHGSSHPEDPHDGSLLVQVTLDGLDRCGSHSGPGREEDRRCVGRVQPDKIAGDVDQLGRPSRRRQAMADSESGPSLIDINA
jgi:hypothetical protein